MCKPKAAGGLGLRPAKEMNKALIAKVGWRLLWDKDSLWARVLRSKYKVGHVHDHTWVVPKSNWSSTWRSVAAGLREVVSQGLGWVLGDGKTIKFWSDRWLIGDPLSASVTALLPPEELGKRVADYWLQGLGWDRMKLSQWLPESIIMKLLAVVVNNLPGVHDSLSWQGTSNGAFTVSSAYSLLCCESEARPCMELFFHQIWRVVVPERVRIFLWLVGHQVIMTNMERARRHLGDTAVCPICNGAVESIIHVLRDCPAMVGIWTRLIPPRKRQEFFTKTLLEWLFDNLRVASVGEGGDWPTVFSMTIWWGWKWRCSEA